MKTRILRFVIISKNLGIILIFLFINITLELSAQTRQLKDYLISGKNNSPVLNEYKNNSDVSGLENEKVQSDYYYPFVEAKANAMEAPVINGIGYDKAITNGSWYYALASASMPLFCKPFAEVHKRKNSLESKQAHWQGEIAWKDVKKQIEDSYSLCYADQEILTITRNQLKVLNEQHELTKKLAEKGIMKGSDVLLLNLEINNNKIILQDQKAKLQQDLHDLNIICGISDTALCELEKPSVSFIPSPVDSSQYLRQFVIDSQIIENQQELFNLKYKPTIKAYADAGLNAVYLSSPQDNLGFSAGVSFQITLFDHGQKKINQQQTIIKLNTINQYKKHFKIKRNQQLNNYLVQTRIADNKLNELNDQLKLYQSLLKVYKEELATGDISMNDFLVVYRNFLQAKRDLIYQQYHKNTIINAYNYWNW